MFSGEDICCLHCKQVCIHSRKGGRGLCSRCYDNVEIRHQYPLFHDYSKGVDNQRVSLSPCIPTRAIPGSPEKIEVLRYRAEHGQELWHPDDAPMDKESIGLPFTMLKSRKNQRVTFFPGKAMRLSNGV